MQQTKNTKAFRRTIVRGSRSVIEARSKKRTPCPTLQRVHLKSFRGGAIVAHFELALMGSVREPSNGRWRDWDDTRNVTTEPVPFNLPWQSGSELGYAAEAQRLNHLSGNGAF